jgi:hypothetical protein
MALQNTRLTQMVVVPTSVGSIYANPASTKTFVRGLLIHNTNTTTETVTIHWVPDSSGSLGTAAAANRIFSLSIVTLDTVIIEIPFSLVMLTTNESIQAATTTASKVYMAVFGDKDA